MSMQTRLFGDGTSLVVRYPWGTYHGGRVLCPDGKVRALHRISIVADTFFSVPAAVKVRGKTVTGYVTGGSDNEPVRFVPYTYRRNHKCFEVPA